MGIVQFAEDVLGIKYLSYNQKEILKLMESNKHEQIVISNHFMRNGKTMITEIYNKYKDMSQQEVNNGMSDQLPI